MTMFEPEDDFTTGETMLLLAWFTLLGMIVFGGIGFFIFMILKLIGVL